MKNVAFLLLIISISACSPGGAITPLASTSTPTRAPGAIALLATPKALPTPISMEEAVVYEGLSIKIGQIEINDQYKTEYGPSRDAPVGMKFLWVQLLLENADDDSIDLPGEDHFSALYGSDEYKPTYGHREGHNDFISLGDTLFHGDPQKGWLRFDIPAQAELKDMQFAFLPESTRLTFARTQSGSSYYDHPVFLWRLEP